MKLIIHIGTEKTGTTSIQGFLKLNSSILNDHGYYVLTSSNRVDFRELAGHCIRNDRYDDFHRNNFINNIEDKKSYMNMFKKRIEKELSSLPDHIHTVVLSSEHLHSRLHYHDEVDSVKKLFSGFFDTFEVIVYLREQLSMATSAYSTALKTGYKNIGDINKYINDFAKKENHYFNFDICLSLWENVFQRKNITVKLFDRNILYKNDIVSDFIYTISEKLLNDIQSTYKKSKNMNESINIFGQDVLALLNNNMPKFIKNVGFNALSVEISNTVSQNCLKGRGKSVEKNMCLSITNRFIESNEKVRERYFPDKKRLFDIDCNKYDVKVDETPKYQLTVIEKLIQMMNNKVSHSEINDIRDAAIALEKTDLKKAFQLMKIAHKLRPDGPVLNKKINEYQKQLDKFESDIPSFDRIKNYLKKIISKCRFLNNIFYRNKSTPSMKTTHKLRSDIPSLTYDPSIDNEVSTDDRIKNYLGDGLDYERDDLKKFISKFQFLNNTFYRGEITLYQKGRDYKGKMNVRYVNDMGRFLSTCSYDHPVVVLFGDKTLKNTNIPVFIKVRDIKKGKGIVLNLNSFRHWNFSELNFDIKWEDKTSEPIWRGVNTGPVTHNDNQRYTLVYNYGKKYNIGYSKIVQYIKIWKNISSDCTYCIKGRVSISEQLKYKYIVSIEGNDVATNLKWILASNSVPIMRKPSKESWLMESKLIPYKHYIPLSDTMDDLDEILNWCIANDDKCKEIALNGRRYINMFLNNDNEKYIEQEILKKYINSYD